MMFFVFCLLHGFLIYTNDKENKVDLAIMKLADHFAKDILEQYTFLHNDLIKTNHELIMKHQYLLAGFPVSKTKTYARTHMREELVVLTQPSQEKVYETRSVDKDKHIIVDIDNKVKDFNDVETTTTLPHLYGLSGSGLWFISDTSSPSEVCLVAIMTEWLKENKATVGTKIEVAINMIEYQLENEYNKIIGDK
jgi:hypothetical protein